MEKNLESFPSLNQKLLPENKEIRNNPEIKVPNEMLYTVSDEQIGKWLSTPDTEEGKQWRKCYQSSFYAQTGVEFNEKFEAESLTEIKNINQQLKQEKNVDTQKYLQGSLLKKTIKYLHDVWRVEVINRNQYLPLDVSEIASQAQKLHPENDSGISYVKDAMIKLISTPSIIADSFGGNHIFRRQVTKILEYHFSGIIFSDPATGKNSSLTDFLYADNRFKGNTADNIPLEIQSYLQFDDSVANQTEYQKYLQQLNGILNKSMTLGQLSMAQSIIGKFLTTDDLQKKLNYVNEVIVYLSSTPQMKDFSKGIIKNINSVISKIDRITIDSQEIIYNDKDFDQKKDLIIQQLALINNEPFDQGDKDSIKNNLDKIDKITIGKKVTLKEENAIQIQKIINNFLSRPLSEQKNDIQAISRLTSKFSNNTLNKNISYLKEEPEKNATATTLLDSISKNIEKNKKFPQGDLIDGMNYAVSEIDKGKNVVVVLNKIRNFILLKNIYNSIEALKTKKGINEKSFETNYDKYNNPLINKMSLSNIKKIPFGEIKKELIEINSYMKSYIENIKDPFFDEKIKNTIPSHSETDFSIDRKNYLKLLDNTNKKFSIDPLVNKKIKFILVYDYTLMKFIQFLAEQPELQAKNTDSPESIFPSELENDNLNMEKLAA